MFQPTQQITLKPVPTEYDLELLMDDIKKLDWGIPLNAKHGYHKKSEKWANCKNNMVHIRITNMKTQKIPNVITLRGHQIYVIKPGENLRQICTYCYKAWHIKETCWKRKQDEDRAKQEKEEKERKENRNKYLKTLQQEKLNVEEKIQRRQEEFKLQEEKIRRLLKEKEVMMRQTNENDTSTDIDIEKMTKNKKTT